MSMQRMTNRVKDWLPSDFAETADLEWFGRHFLGEQFIIVTWPGCSEDDPRYQKLVDRIQHQIAPPEHHESGGPADALAAIARKPFEELTPDERLALDRQRAGELGDKLGLSPVGDYFENWGERGEKWLRGDHDLWYFVTPEGQLYRWAGRSNMLNWVYRMFQRTVLGQTKADGELVAHVWPPTYAGATQRVSRESGDPDGSDVQVDHDRTGHVEAAVAQGWSAVAARRGRRGRCERSPPKGAAASDRAPCSARTASRRA